MRIKFDIADYERRKARAMAGIAIDLQEAFKRKLIANGSVDTAQLLSEIRVEVNAKLGIIDVYMPQRALYLEYGTGGVLSAPPGLSPTKRKMPVYKEGDEWHTYLDGWAIRVLGDEKAAWAVAKHIQLYGTQPHPFIRPTLHQMFVQICRRNLIDAFKPNTAMVS